jgi:hypothetical protein
MSKLDVYRQVALYSIQHHRNLEVLNYAGHTDELAEYSPSWIPRWDSNIFENPLSPFLYNAAQRLPPMLRASTDLNCLIVQGLNMGSVERVSTVLRYQDEQSLKDSTAIGCAEDSLLTLSRMMALDRVRRLLGSSNAEERTAMNLGEHVADFSAYLLPIIKEFKQDGYIAVETTWCDICKEFIAYHSKATMKPSMSYTCQICEVGSYDICEKCYVDGKKCKDPDHILELKILPSIWCPFTADIVSKLETRAADGDGNRFYGIANTSYRRRKFMATARGWQGVGSRSIKAGDVLVVLFGSRVPFLLRKSGGSYRLISNCYIHGLMDGEAIEMWKDGQLEAEDFHIQ